MAKTHTCVRCACGQKLNVRATHKSVATHTLNLYQTNKKKCFLEKTLRASNVEKIGSKQSKLFEKDERQTMQAKWIVFMTNKDKLGDKNTIRQTKNKI